MVANPSAVWKSMRTKYSFAIVMSVIAIERNVPYSNTELKLKNFFSIKIPVWD